MNAGWVKRWGQHSSLDEMESFFNLGSAEKCIV